MNLTSEQKAIGRRNFLKALAGTPALAALGAGAALHGPIHGGPVKAALIGAGDEGRVLLGQCRKEFIDLRALCDINPKHFERASDGLIKAGWTKPRYYEDWRDMLQKEDLEAVLIAVPLWAHAEVSAGCLEAGKHVLCEKMMAWDVPGCHRMLEAARKNHRLLEIGYQRFYNPMYQAAYENIIKPGILGDMYYARLVWHRNAAWRRNEAPPSPHYNPDKWGYPDWEHLLNWRMYRRYSQGLMAELGSHQIAVANWFFNSTPYAVYSSGGIYRYKDGREVNDHIYVTLDYPQGRTATFTSIQSNKFDNYYEQYMGTKGTLILAGEAEAFLFNEEDARATTMEVTKQTSNPVMDASESRAADAAGRTVAGRVEEKLDRLVAYRLEISGFCSSIRTGIPLHCGPERAVKSATACILANESADKKARLEVPNGAE
ncbi:MAG TPA: Gfo/Idh/MocA family oxidoreductase [Acidobacteriota bacterium]|jgi:predicted dehydrogenase|nr:Gfo/Idh/MocA family oxidoreductase [Acidobacteriota bacterium]